jgi:hypothetical protein
MMFGDVTRGSPTCHASQYPAVVNQNPMRTGEEGKRKKLTPLMRVVCQVMNASDARPRPADLRHAPDANRRRVESLGKELKARAVEVPLHGTVSSARGVTFDAAVAEQHKLHTLYAQHRSVSQAPSVVDDSELHWDDLQSPAAPPRAAPAAMVSGWRPAATASSAHERLPLRKPTNDGRGDGPPLLVDRGENLAATARGRPPSSEAPTASSAHTPKWKTRIDDSVHFNKRVADLESRYREHIDMHRELNGALGEAMRVEEQVRLDQRARRDAFYADALSYGTSAVATVATLEHLRALENQPPIPVRTTHQFNARHVDPQSLCDAHRAHFSSSQPLHPAHAHQPPLSAVLVPAATAASTRQKATTSVQTATSTQTTDVPAVESTASKPTVLRNASGVEIVRAESPVVPYPRRVKTLPRPETSPQRRAHFVDGSPGNPSPPPSAPGLGGRTESFRRSSILTESMDTSYTTRAPSGSQPPLAPRTTDPGRLSIASELPSVRASTSILRRSGSMLGYSVDDFDSVIQEEEGETSRLRQSGDRAIRVVFGDRYQRPADIPPTSSSSSPSPVESILSRSTSMRASAQLGNGRRASLQGLGNGATGATLDALITRFDAICTAAEKRLEAATQVGTTAGTLVADRDAPVPAPAQLKVTVTTKGKAERAKVIEFLRTARRRMIELEKRRVALAERKAAALLALKKHRLEKAMKRVGRVGLQAAINDAGIAEDFADDFYDTALSATRIAGVAGSIAEDDLAMDDEAGSMGDDMYDEIGMEMDDGVMAVEDDMMDEMMGDDIDDPFAEDIDDIDYEESALVDEITDVNFALQRLGMDDVDFDESGIASGGDNGSGSRSKSRIVSRRDGGAAIVSSESLQLRAGASGSLPMADESRMIPQRLDDVVYEEEMEEENDLPMSPQHAPHGGGLIVRKRLTSPTDDGAPPLPQVLRTTTAQPPSAVTLRGGDVESEHSILSSSMHSSQLSAYASPKRRPQRDEGPLSASDVVDEVSTVRTESSRHRQYGGHKSGVATLPPSVAGDSVVQDDVTLAASSGDASLGPTTMDEVSSGEVADESGADSADDARRSAQPDSSTTPRSSTEYSSTATDVTVMSTDGRNRRRRRRADKLANAEERERRHERDATKNRRKYLLALNVPTFTELFAPSRADDSFVGSSLTSSDPDLSPAAARQRNSRRREHERGSNIAAAAALKLAAEVRDSMTMSLTSRTAAASPAHAPRAIVITVDVKHVPELEMGVESPRRFIDDEVAQVEATAVVAAMSKPAATEPAPRGDNVASLVENAAAESQGDAVYNDMDTVLGLKESDAESSAARGQAPARLMQRSPAALQDVTNLPLEALGKRSNSAGSQHGASGPVSYADDLIALARWKEDQLQLFRSLRPGATADINAGNDEPFGVAANGDAREIAAGGSDSTTHLATLEVLLDAFSARSRPEDEAEDESTSYSGSEYDSYDDDDDSTLSASASSVASHGRHALGTY